MKRPDGRKWRCADVLAWFVVVGIVVVVVVVVLTELRSRKFDAIIGRLLSSVIDSIIIWCSFAFLGRSNL